MAVATIARKPSGHPGEYFGANPLGVRTTSPPPISIPNSSTICIQFGHLLLPFNLQDSMTATQRLLPFATSQLTGSSRPKAAHFHSNRHVKARTVTLPSNGSQIIPLDVAPSQRQGGRGRTVLPVDAKDLNGFAHGLCDAIERIGRRRHLFHQGCVLLGNAV